MLCSPEVHTAWPTVAKPSHKACLVCVNNPVLKVIPHVRGHFTECIIAHGCARAAGGAQHVCALSLLPHVQHT